VEICWVICDNFPAQVVGLRQFLDTSDRLQSAVMHIFCFNHMFNLVFARTIKTQVFSDVLTTLPEIIRILHSGQSSHIIGMCCSR
jgi:hypothetical protein